MSGVVIISLLFDRLRTSHDSQVSSCEEDQDLFAFLMFSIYSAGANDSTECAESTCHGPNSQKSPKIFRGMRTTTYTDTCCSVLGARCIFTHVMIYAS